MDALNTARNGMTAAQQMVDASATRVAQMTVPGNNVDIVQETATQIQATQQFAASAQVVKFSNEMWNSLMDALKS
jgi:flagellar basal body rod protein FlgB